MAAHPQALRHAVAEGSHALNEAPDFKPALLRRARAYEQMHQYDRAVSDLEAAAKADALREEQEATLGKLGGIVLTLRRPTNDKGILYGSVSQRDISDALIQGGFNVGISAVRLSVAIRRTGNYDVPIQFGKELRENITIVVESESVIEEMADDAPEEGGEAAVEAAVDASAPEAAEASSDES